jgi:hypothetical protein
VSHRAHPFFMCLLAIHNAAFTNCSVRLPICWLDYLFFWWLIFWALSILWLLIPCQMNSLQKFSPML